MAIYVNGKKIVNSLIIDGKSGGNANKSSLGTFIADSYIDNTNGNLVPYVAVPSWSATDFLEISGNKLYLAGISFNGESGYYNAFYNENKQFISNFSTNDSIVTIPVNAKYIRLSNRTSYFSNSSVYFYDIEE